ncbi:MAG: L-iditol 2-dehydrogenase [Halanaerobiales bacterium]|nr:L-iditol 2-dehydrogenase [Halanaerobiales bacterium]
MDKMKAVYLEKVKEIKMKEIEKPTPGEGEVLVQIKSVGVCGSDIHYYNHGRIGDFIVEKPLILGHESAGKVVEVGPGVTSLKVGDRVALEPGIPCRKCEHCKEGRYNLCPDIVFMATPPVDGAFVEYVTFPEDFAFKLPDNMSYDEGALIEPLSVGVYSTERAGLKAGMKVAILGAGPIGLATLQAAKVYGADVAISDINDFRLSYAEKLGADKIINAATGDALEKFNEYFNGGADVVFETAGTVPTTKMTTKVAKRGGKVVIIGLAPADTINYNFVDVSAKELDVLGIFRYANVYKRSIDLVSKGEIDLKSMVTHSFTLDQVQEALEFADKNKDKAIKVVVRP